MTLAEAIAAYQGYHRSYTFWAGQHAIYGGCERQLEEHMVAVQAWYERVVELGGNI
jgi:hypothetical protein